VNWRNVSTSSTEYENIPMNPIRENIPMNPIHEDALINANDALGNRPLALEANIPNLSAF
jgi:hypothetical protein